MKYTITTIITALVQFGLISNLPNPSPLIDPLSFLLGNLQIIALFVALHLADKHCSVSTDAF